MAYNNGPKIVTSGLILCLDAGNPKSYSGSGVTWYDLSGNGNHFTMQGTLSWTAKTGFSSFDGNTYGNGNKFYRDNFPQNLKTSQGGYGLTVMVIAKSNGSGSFKKLIGNADSENYIDLYQSTGSSPIFWSESGDTIYYNDAIDVTANPIVISDDKWRFLWATNYNLGGTSNPSKALTIGNEPNSSGAGTNAYPWAGNISFIALYNRVLNTKEISQNFKALKGRFML